MLEEYNKLVRDDVPELIEADGDDPITHVTEGAEYRRRLHDKLDEEVAEFHENEEVDELADVLEVVAALATAAGVSESELEDLRNTKANQRGRFDEGVVLEAVER